MSDFKKIKIAYIGGGSQNWAPNIIRDIIFKKGMEKVQLDFQLLDLDFGRAQAIKSLFAAKLKEWKIDNASFTPTTDARAAISNATL